MCGVQGVVSDQAKFARPGDRLGPPLDLQLVEEHPVVPLDRVHGQEQPVADLLVREALADQPQDVQLALAQGLEQPWRSARGDARRTRDGPSRILGQGRKRRAAACRCSPA